MTRSGLRYAAVAAGVAALAALLRFQFIEPQALGILCASQAAPWWCLPREAIILAFHFEVVGGIALALGVAAFFLDGPRAVRLAWVTLPFAATGLALYNATWAAPAILLSLMAVVRAPPTATPPARP
ncbi:MAG: hypothetical protein MUE39_05020 [Gammaproteobacteria bacterium]|nr:hypothetical protein [Gammaproteobacteria bacterium]